ncbi:MAG: glycoside hydrolase family 2, partial [Cytophagaceae bacterium]
WDGADIKYNVLYAVGYVGGKAVAKDYIVLHHLPPAPHAGELTGDKHITAAQPGYKYLYRVNCGGPAYLDRQGQTWQADQPRNGPETWGSESWTREFAGLNPFFASQRRTFDPISGTADGPLFQRFRYGRAQLRYAFPVPAGEYLVELYFVEPWLGTGGGLDCTGWRLFDVAINNQTVLKDLDIWREAGHDQALKKTVKVRVTNGELVLSFPHVAAGQALVSAIAIASLDASAKAAPAPTPIITNLRVANPKEAADWSSQTWLDTGEVAYTGELVGLSKLPPALYGAEWLRAPLPTDFSAQSRATFQVATAADVYIGVDATSPALPTWLRPYEDTKTTLELAYAGGRRFRVYRQRFAAVEVVALGQCERAPTLPYLVAVQRATTIEPAYDLKPITGYKPATARLVGSGLVRETVNTKESITFKAARGAALEWTIQTGVADTYLLTFRYANQSAKPLAAKLTIMGADGKLLIKEEAVELLPSRPGKWNYLTTSTGGMINAGSYHVRLAAADAAGLSVSGLDVQ